MKRTVCAILVATFAGLPARSQDQGARAGDAAGTWQGVLEIGPTKLRLVFHVKRVGDGYQAKADSPDQGATGLAVDTFTVEGRVVKLAMKRLSASFEGKLSADGKKIVGTFTQGGPVALTLERTDVVAGPVRPQEPKPPFPYRALDVYYSHDPAGDPGATLRVVDAATKTQGRVRLAATLTLPKGEGPFAAAVLITGSGPQNRDEALLGHKPFLVLADALTRRGIAVLRYDDRGVAGSTGDFRGATSADFANDALAGVHYLRTREDIDKGKIGLVGHSEGGLVGPMAAARSDAVAFVVMLAGPGVPGADIILLQNALIARSAGVSEEHIAEGRRTNDAIFALLAEKGADAGPEVRELLGRAWDSMPEALRKQSGGARKVFVERQTAMVSSPWFRFFLKHDPRPDLRKLTCPVLAINGEKDLQVDPDQNLPEIAKALASNKDAKTLELAGLNHLFQTCKTGALSEYGSIQETFAPAALKVVGDWIVERFVSK